MRRTYFRPVLSSLLFPFYQHPTNQHKILLLQEPSCQLLMHFLQNVLSFHHLREARIGLGPLPSRSMIPCVIHQVDIKVLAARAPCHAQCKRQVVEIRGKFL
ncbi:hypothetical protein NGA_2042600, partial [Nannochloropsis gaditana CCMP526]|uniref:uncharacterized protein n=1 Tax=Nannochloropsis gaditana (strain CCMP526) TaxID=1093141 RepID=UPI00029F7244